MVKTVVDGMTLEDEGRPSGTSTLDLALHIVDYLASQGQSVSLAQIAKNFSASKATVYRHLVTLQRHNFVRQDPETSRYEPGIKLLVLGEAVRNRFQVATTAHAELSALRERTGQAVTICGLVDRKLIVLDLLHGRTVIEFGTRPGTELSIHATAHGKVWLAFGDRALLEALITAPLHVWTPKTLVAPEQLSDAVARVQKQGWATAADELITAVNALAAPVFNHNNEIAASIAMVGSTQYISATPDATQIEEVCATARRISERLGWRASA
jgi:DNA-binding IclR family transcriptional regulator